MPGHKRINLSNICRRWLPPVPLHHRKQLALWAALTVTIISLVLINVDHGGQTSSAKYTFLRGRLKSTGNYSIPKWNATEPITWYSLGTLLPDEVTDMSFPEEFFRCHPEHILKALDSYNGFDSLSRCDRIFYNRVPKCGSRTMLSVFKELAIQRNYTVHAKLKPQRRSFFPSMPKLIKFGMNFAQLEDPFIYSQHLHFVNFTQLGVPPPIYINVIRDPVERVISHYYYSQYGSKFVSKEITYNVSLDDCVQFMDDCHFLPIHIVLPYFCGQTKLCRKDDVATLQRAKRTLRQSFLVVGLTEDLPAFVEVLETLMPKFFTNATNVFNELEDVTFNKTQTAKKPHVQPATITLLKDMLSLEYEFYNFAKQRFYTLYNKIRPG